MTALERIEHVLKGYWEKNGDPREIVVTLSDATYREINRELGFPSHAPLEFVQTEHGQVRFNVDPASPVNTIIFTYTPTQEES